MFPMTKSKNDGLAFDDLLKEAVKVRKAVNELHKHGRLSPEAFLKKGLENAGITPERLDELEKLFESGPRFEVTRMFIRKAVERIRDKTYSVPPFRLNHISAFMWRDFDVLCAELSSAGANPFAAFCVAARQGIRKYPEVFGSVQDMTEHQAKIKEYENRLQSLYQQIEASWSKTDIDVVPAGGDLAYIRYKGTPVSVFGRNSAEALLNHLARQK